jgi:hypothetical protein
MINYEREDSFFEHYKNFMEGEKNLSEEEFFDQIKKPEFSKMRRKPSPNRAGI